MIVMKLKNQTWYWMSHPHEGDIFYPVFILNDKYLMLDGEPCEISNNTGAIFDAAVMPQINPVEEG
jgi:hypothetical protein